ncbi:MAG: hypothetical protein IPM46_16825 [Flavobacteriales bacterium]|nr:hypothetical protein [Flavobacteriales bacterium]
MRLWSTMTMGTDIFVGFIEKGLRSLKPGGRLCFIVADRWQHNAYGRKLRKLTSERYAVDAMFEMTALMRSQHPSPPIRPSPDPEREPRSVLYASAQTSLDAQGGERLGLVHT